MKFVVKQDDENDRIPSLLKEYELNINRLEGFENRIIQVLGVGLVIVGGISGFFIRQQDIQPELVWLALFFTSAMFMYIILLSYMIAICNWNARILSHRINKIFEEKVLISFDREAPAPTYLSFKRGNFRPKVLYMTLIILMAILNSFLFIISTRIIYNSSHLQAVLFLLCFLSLIILALILVQGFNSDIPDFYRKYLQRFHDGEPIPFTIRQPIQTNSSKFDALALIAPRPLDIFTKAWFFIFGLLAALTFRGLQGYQVSLVNVIFNPGSTPWKAVSTIPIWAVFALWVVYFVVEEVLLQQAKLTWDDIRDKERDKRLILNQSRAIASGRISVRLAIYSILVRLALAFVLSLLLGGISLLLIFVLIIVHEAVYVLIAKPRAAKHPLQLLLWLSFNNALRLLAGVVAIVGPQVSPFPIVLIFVVFYFCTFGGMAAQWKMEAEYYGIDVRPQSEYYFNNKAFWQHVGVIAAVLVGMLLIFVQSVTLPRDFWFSSLVRVYHSQIEQNYFLADVFCIILALVLISLFMTVTIALVYFSKKIEVGQIISQGARKMKPILVPICELITVTLLILFLATFSPSEIRTFNEAILLWILLMINVLYMIMYEGMTYPEYANFGFVENIKKKLKDIYALIFNLKL